MAGQTNLQRRFDDKKREQLSKLFAALGTDNPHEAEAARGRIDSLLREHHKSWGDIIELLGGAAIRADLARDIIALGSSDPDERATARRNIFDLLGRHRKRWNDLADVLCAHSHEAWACDPLGDDPPRVNPLALVDYLLREYLELREHEYVALSLWSLHSHVYEQFMHTPRLVLRSPAPGCGKTTLLLILEKLTARGKKYDSITTAALLRRIDRTHLTALLDEAHNLGVELQSNGNLRALFNSGHGKGGKRSLMERGEDRDYSTFAPLALALPIAFGGLPSELNSRSITVAMERNAGQRKLKRFDSNHPDRALDVAYEQILLWRRDVELDPDPEMPAGLGMNRIADNWRVLLSIADGLGWSERARDAMLIFAREQWDADLRAALLADIRRVFTTRDVDSLSTKTLLDALHDLDGSGWSHFCGVDHNKQPHALTDSDLALMLKPFRIRPRSIWPAHRTPESRSSKGYRRGDFETAWRKYCADDGTASQASNIRSLRSA
jgi:hypothetical protein